MSSYHIFHIKPLPDISTPPPSPPTPDPETQTDSPRGIASALRLDVWKSPFRNVLLALFFFHLTQYLSVPIYPLFNVRVLGLNDNHLGNGAALYYLAVLIASTQLGRFVQRYGHKKVTGLGVAGMAIYPLMLAFAQNVLHFYGISFLGGFLFALVNGAFVNYMLEHIPPHDRPSHLAWHTLMFNFAVLSSSIVGPLIADGIGLAAALILFGLLRIAAGFVILKWG